MRDRYLVCFYTKLKESSERFMERHIAWVTLKHEWFITIEELVGVTSSSGSGLDFCQPLLFQNTTDPGVM
jgi:hypothetical protein